MPHKFDPSPADLETYYERRRSFAIPLLLHRFGLSEGQRLVELGCGPGAFTLPAAEIVGPTGRVYAADINPKLLDHLRPRVPPWVSLHLTTEESLPLEDCCADAALAAFVLHELERPAPLLADLTRLLTPGGKLWVLEWDPAGPGNDGPDHDRLSPDTARGLLAEAGFTVTKAGQQPDLAIGTPIPDAYYLLAEKG